MKYTILGFNQKIALEMNLDLTDLMILRYFIDFKDTDKMVLEIIENKPFYWIEYRSLIDTIPIIKINNKVALRRRLKKLEEKDILIHFCKKDKGTYSFYGVGTNYEKLLQSATEKFNGQTEKFNPLTSNVQTPPTQKFNQNINLLNNKSIKDKYIDLKFIDDVIDNIKITDEQYKKLLDKYGKQVVSNQILGLDNYIANGKGKKYKDHYRVLNTWCKKDNSKISKDENRNSTYNAFKFD